MDGGKEERKMTQGWENHEPAPLEFFHALIMKNFHELRRNRSGDDINVSITGNDLAKIVGAAKLETYEKYPKQVNSNAILKTEI